MAKANKSKTPNSNKIHQELERAEVKGPEAVLQLSEYGLLRVGSLGLAEADWVSSLAASSLLTSRLMTALDAEKLEEKWRRLSTGCPALDGVLCGGFAVRGITEIAGESGCGKTQLCLQLCLSVQYPNSMGGLDAGAVYICTEESFPVRRLQQLFGTYPKQRHSANMPLNMPKFGDNIFVEHVADAAGMRQCVLGRLPKLLSEQKVGLIVIDSIAGVFRSSYELNEMKSRAQDMRTVGGQLHKIASQHGICVICVNQVSAGSLATGCTDKCIPALGLAWSNLVTTRIQLHRLDPAGVDSLPTRTLQVIFAPDLPQESISYSITSGGVFGSREGVSVGF